MSAIYIDEDDARSAPSCRARLMACFAHCLYNAIRNPKAAALKFPHREQPKSHVSEAHMRLSSNLSLGAIMLLMSAT